METKPTVRHKAKNKKSAFLKPKTPKKRKTSDGPTCSMFLAELTRKLSSRKKQDEEAEEAETSSSNGVVQMIIASLTNVLFTFSKKSPERKESPMKMETLHSLAPELISIDTVEIKLKSDNATLSGYEGNRKIMAKIQRMPIPMDAFEPVPSPLHPKIFVETEDAAVNTGGDFDVAEEISKHVGTLKKISLIAEEFNQKTAKNLKEIVDSVQEDLIKKLEQIQAEQNAIEAENFAKTMMAEELITAQARDNT